MHLHSFLSVLSQNGPLYPHLGVGIAQRRLARDVQGVPVWHQKGVLTALANEAGADRIAMTGLANELAVEESDGWALIPYGEWPHEEGLQRFGRTEAEEMVGYFNNPWNRIKRALVGMPIYRGHPDLPALANQYPDKTVYGYILAMEARAAGLALRLVLSEAGAALVNEKGLTKFSPHWLAKMLGMETGRKIYAPVFMKSIGLTDRPNIAVTSLVNAVPAGPADTNPQSKPAMNKLILALLAALGRPLANEATETQITEALTSAVPVATSLLARPEPTALANEQTARTGAEAKVTELTTALANEKTALANEKAAHLAAVEAHATTLVNHAITAGRITEAQKPVWLARLKRDFATESVALANEQKAVKTTARTVDLGARKGANVARDQFTALVNEAMPKHENNWHAAWNAVKATAAGKALYEQMETTSTAAA